MQQGVTPIQSWTHVRLLQILFEHIFTYLCNKLVMRQLQNAKLNFPKFCKIYAWQNQKTNLIYLYIHLVETFALILHSKIVFNFSNALNPLIPGGNKR